MTNEEIFGCIDHTLLKAFAAWEEIRTLCDEAIRYKTASVCIPPSYVKPCSQAYGEDLTICTVIGFPLGYNVCAVKVLEAEEAIGAGASELDMVINITDVKNGYFDRVEKEIAALRKTAGGRILKVIVETCYLSCEEKIRLCKIVTDTGADYIKTSTGFGSGGAVLDDIRLFKEHIGRDVKMKAAGGVKTREDLEAFLGAGCSRIGTSSAVRLLTRD
ncbi:MAG: deoxyribose-phosphate aldolase [Treponema sp.]|jgi:deoxyribose-phosphate aldolase|nr:deoxyribose-phosphate aldolase [Treponema sp.]